MTIPTHVTTEQAVEIAVRIMRSVSFTRAQRDARQRLHKSTDCGIWADQAAAVYRHELMRCLAMIPEPTP
jgi:hypothetical protein